jgi:hypothetical protein
MQSFAAQHTTNKPVKKDQPEGPAITLSTSREGSPAVLELERDLLPSERELLQEVLRAVRLIRYGSVLLTMHDGHVVEIQKTERIRKGSAKQT